MVFYRVVWLGAFVSVLVMLSSVVEAQSRTNTLLVDQDPRGDPELTICNQNLEHFGTFNTARVMDAFLSNDEYKVKERALVKRFIDKGCDVIAVQELLGKNEDEALKGLDELAYELRRRSGRTFEARTGPSNDRFIRQGFLVAQDRADILNVVSYNRVELPKIQKKEKRRGFIRGPLEIQLQVKPRGTKDAFHKVVTVVTFHFKSKAGSANDPTGLEWETYRMQMAEALRKIVENRHAESFGSGERLLVVLGDRNSNFDTASAKILEGVLTLKNFQQDGGCRLSKRGAPLCQGGSAQPQKLFSVLTGDPETKDRPGTFRYKKEYSWLDEILLTAPSLRSAWEHYDVEGNYESGVVYEPKEASDHAMVYVRLNW